MDREQKFKSRVRATPPLGRYVKGIQFGSYATIAVVGVYMVVFQDWGSREHVFSPSRAIYLAPSKQRVRFNHMGENHIELINPYLEQHNALIARIVSNVEKLNESVIELNRSLQQINQSNMNIEIVSAMWSNYQRNVLFNLEGIGQLANPADDKQN